MASDGTAAESTASLAVCVGRRMAELYDSADLPGPPEHLKTAALPGHLPGFGEMSQFERACALAAHVSADLASLGQALGLQDLPSAQPVLEALAVPGHSRDDVRAVVLDLYLRIRDLVAGSNVSAALGLGLGRMLADTVLLPTPGDQGGDFLMARDMLAERFEGHLLENALGWLEDLDTSIPQRSAAVVRAGLADWQQWIARLHRLPDGAIDPAEIDANVIRALRRQGDIWRRLLTGEQRPDQLLDRQAYIGAAIRMLAAAWHIGLHYLWRWSGLIALAATAAVTAAWAALTYAPDATSQVATVAVSATGFLGISWLSVRATLGRALRQAESALWEAEVTAAIAKAAATTPRNRNARSRGTRQAG